MTRPGPVDLARLRRRPHRTKLYLSIYEPETVLKAQVNDADAGRGDYQITFDNVTDGDANLILGGMTMYIGSVDGGKDLGRIRVRSIAGSVITIAENSDIEWIDDAYIWVVRFWEPWAVFTRIVLDANNVPTFYKDYDILYTDQNSNFDPVVNMGPHFAAFRETGTVHVDYSSSGSFDPGGGALSSYEWWFEGGDPTGSVEAHPSGIAYSDPGHYTSHLKITTAGGKSLTGYRHVSIYDRPGEGPVGPLNNWGLTGLEGNRSSGGYSSKFWIREEADFDKIVDGALVVLFSDSWYGEERISIGGNAYDRPQVLFVGYIEGESVRYNSYTSRLEFRAASITIISDLRNTFSVSLESKTGPSYWYEMLNLTVDKGLIHFLRWQTTLLTIADFSQTGDTKPVQYIDFSRGTIYSEAQNLLENAYGAELVADRQGKMWTEIDVRLMITGSRSAAAYPEIMDIERQDWIGQINFDREQYDLISYLEAGGIAYSGPATGTFEPYIGGSPGEAPSYAGSVQRRTGLVLAGQADVNEFVGLDFAKNNAVYPRLTFTLSGDYRFIDIAPQEFLRLTLEQSDTYRGLVWDKKRFIPTSIGMRYDPRKETLIYEISLAEETDGPPGETVIIPVDPPFDEPDLPYWDIQFPPLPPLPGIGPIIEPEPGLGELVYVCYEQQLARTRNFWDATPNWEDVTVPGDLGITRFTGFRLDPASPQSSALLVTENAIWRTDNLDAASPSWAAVYNTALYPSHLIGTVQHVQAWINGRLWSAGCIRQPSPSGCPVNFAPCHYHARSGAGGVGWEFHSAGVSEGNKGSPNMVQPTTWAGGSLYMGGQKQLYYSADVGTVFILRDNNQTYWLHSMAHLGNSGGAVAYFTRDISPGGNKLLRVTDDAGVSSISISPLFDGVRWWPRINIYGNAPQAAENFWIHPKTGIGYAAMQGPGKGYGIFAQYASGGWLVKAQFSGLVGPMMINFADQGEKQYLMGDANSEKIMGSPDIGNTWFDKLGDFEGAVRSLFGIGSKICMQVVWTV